jgi:GT2 family glycosyltransferase/glycosyltransferase involved in cell wall biosynthesis
VPADGAAKSYAIRLEGQLANGKRLTTQLTTTVTHGRSLVDIKENDARTATEITLQLRLEAFLASQAQLEMPQQLPPRVSVVIPVLDQSHYLLAALESIRSEATTCAIEVIVVDNGSGSEVPRLLESVSGIKVITNERNLGFARACNQGASHASGESLLFLNTDCIPLPGAVAAALGFLDCFPHVGAVGATLLRAHGKLGEAGAFVLPNGTTVPRGRGGSRQSLLYSMPLVVDYCSAAFLLTPRKVFLRLGGFFEGFEPAYYEDVDYCCRLRQLNLLTVVVPSVNAFHIERRSSLDDCLPDVLINRHREIFVSRHPALFKKSQTRYLKAGNSILFVDDCVPAAYRGQGQGRAAQLLSTLQLLGLNVRFYPVNNAPDIEIAGLEVVRPGADEAEADFLRRMAQSVDGLFVSRPQHMEVVQRILRSVDFLGPLPIVIYDAEGLQAKREVLKIEALQDIELSDSDIIEVASNEVVVATDADVILTVSDQEAETFRDFGFSNLKVVSYGAAVYPTERLFANRFGILTVGPLLEQDTPNADGLRWFIKEVFPWLAHLMQAGECLFHSIGENRLAEFEHMQNEQFKLLGAMLDLAPAYDRYRVFVAPTRFAAGIPIKVIEAAAYGLPIVASPLLASQLGWQDEKDLLVGYSPQDFAAKCAALHVNEDLWLRLRNNALNRVREQFDARQFDKALREAVCG